MTTVRKESLSEEQFDQLLRFFQVFSNESRLKLIGHLAGGEKSVGELADVLNLKEPTVSHHLAELKGIGLVSARAEGTMRIYRLETKALETISKDIFARPNLAALVKPSELTEEERILRTWVKDGRIVDIPAQEKKKQILIRWVARQIDPARRWTEREFSEWLSQFNEDYAFLRRYLVDNHYMARENGIYWRTPESDPVL
ncbi:Transcriptional regulator, ArsR family [Candidatus Promineifilum breve]|uniref:Transcriptional regulator, ArsR family n=1 Tax=Candidatus Promineifilum breve TaxID=1806508 RepID=A0A160T3W1_9CHLR|nr:metalloregulator ArsR/SmtB family transcription factor [Candidatus Promineifilum breve]CUS04736.2 Transcriptional regulator, ArsR family [Candidatus Promineifilum breve]